MVKIWSFYLIVRTFKQSWSKNACCASKKRGGFHRRCICDASANSRSCEERCIDDIGCKGYVIYRPTSVGSCHLATTSDCSPDCRGPFNTKNIRKLDPSSFCGRNRKGIWNGGCYIKDPRRTNRGNNFISEVLKMIITIDAYVFEEG